MQVKTVDVAVIGAGTAGMLAYRSAVREGRSAVLIEAGAYGTTCALEGCMPSKLLIAAAERARMLGSAEVFGVSCDRLRVDGRAVMARVRSERDRFVGYTRAQIDAMPAADLLRGQACFQGPNDLRVGDQSVRANAFVVATGSRAWVPPQLTALGDRLLVSADLFEWPDLPASFIVVGTGIIALELGQALAQLGVDVTFIGRGRNFGPLTDPDLAEQARDLFSRKLKVLMEANIVSAAVENKSVRLQVHTPQGEQTLMADYVLAATGRRPNLDGLMLQNTAVEFGTSGRPVYDPQTLQCGHTNIFMAGDVTGNLALQHEAADEGRIAGRNAARFPNLVPGSRRSHLSIVFSDPQMALVGQHHSQLIPGSYVSGCASFENQGRSRIMAVNEGLLKVYADRFSGTFLGAEMIGPAAEHLGHLLAWSHQQGLTIQQMLDMPYYHPTIEEALRTALGSCRRAFLATLESMPVEPGYLA